MIQTYSETLDTQLEPLFKSFDNIEISDRTPLNKGHLTDVITKDTFLVPFDTL